MSYLNSPLAWAGSKQKLLSRLIPILEKHRKGTFIEPFVGAFNVSLNFPECSNYIVRDSNRDLINLYETIAKDSERLVELCERNFALNPVDNYHEIRRLFNKSSRDGLVAAMYFLYLNKYGFNGLCRYNSKGEINVSIGSKTECVSPPTQQIRSLRTFFEQNNVSLKQSDFEDTFKEIENLPNEALVYCDPPYVKLNSNFRYTAKDFGLDEHNKLKDLAKKSKHTVMISNHYTDFTKELYSDAYDLVLFDVKRTISRDSNTRGKAKECLAIYK